MTTATNKLLLIALCALGYQSQAQPMALERIPAKLTAVQRQQLNHLTAQLHHPISIDSTKLADPERTIVYTRVGSPLLDVVYDNRQYVIDHSGERQCIMVSDGISQYSFTYDTVQQVLRFGISGYGGWRSVVAYFRQGALVFEIYSRGEGYASSYEFYNADSLIYPSGNAYGITTFPHPLKPGKLIAVAANIAEPIMLESYTILATNGHGNNKRYLIEAFTDSTNIFYPVREKKCIDVDKQTLHTMDNHSNTVYYDLYAVGGNLSRCGYQDYLRVSMLYTAPFDPLLVDTIYQCKSGVVGHYQPSGRMQTRKTAAGYYFSESKRQVRRLIRKNKIHCESLNETDEYGQQIEATPEQYGLYFRDKFVLYLNREKIFQ